MNRYLNDIFSMAVYFAAAFAILSGFIESVIRKKRVIVGIIFMIAGVLLLIYFRHYIGDEIVPIG